MIINMIIITMGMCCLLYGRYTHAYMHSLHLYYYYY